MDFRIFNPVCPQKTHYDALFLDGAIAEWTDHTSTLVALCHVTERWNAARGKLHVITCAHMLRVSATLLFLPRNFKIAFTFRFNYVEQKEKLQFHVFTTSRHKFTTISQKENIFGTHVLELNINEHDTS
jgi:hypothetical protein